MSLHEVTLPPSPTEESHTSVGTPSFQNECVVAQSQKNAAHSPSNTPLPRRPRLRETSSSHTVTTSNAIITSRNTSAS